MNPNPGQTSGNGNPAILFVGILFVVFCSLVFVWYKILKEFTLNRMTFIMIVTVLVIQLTSSFLYQRQAFFTYKKLLASVYQEQFGFIDWQYIEDITSFMSIHVNSQYFNVNTYFMFVSSSVLIALIIRKLISMIKAEEKN
ncbi:hypothetical protein [Bacillus suaedaesalsae]|uniref:Uncharacterized protein n=1 Tax=Bacillus suaedaesalsae TaxID=2810349 RepID=A0ABS2DHH6_9BACI|nr:hypothetical protein [Bacillus suaedaesalsae]MBM6617862.1 hypothetical protein [Bacillus suaedaesalsae]